MTPPWGRDSLLRWLRALSVLAFLALVVVVVLDPTRGNDLTLVALLSGATLLQLGYEVGIPLLGGRRKDDDDDV